MAKSIICKWKESSRCLIQPDGQVFQCCFLKLHFVDYENKREVDGRSHPIIKDYLSKKEEYNIKNDSLKNILNKEWFQKTLPNSLIDYDKAPKPCKRVCTIESKK
jgi:hypothetical protein